MSAAVMDDIELRVATAEDSKRMMEFLHEHYYQEEPLTIGCEPKQPDAADESFLLSNIPHGTCLLALQGDRIMGAVVAGPKDKEEAQLLDEEAAQHAGTKWGRIVGFLALVEREANVFERYGVDKAVHAHALGVDTTMRGRALGARLITALAARGKELGYPLLTLDCTSVYSSRLSRRLGCDLINSKLYSDYKDVSGVQLICPPAPHDRVETYALLL
ncbi:CG15766 [Drosophila busckii]|uniref:aralkylamine N-acetyltransferase n=1 Tax=Drosophila busckii TaxID=30019 RepID=A0A0M4EY82_DROBS|nr:uncharacterized protein LOC108606881 [Drosophila busckii]ALC48905.1 CG15766 [Drosophila busckii]